MTEFRDRALILNVDDDEGGRYAVSRQLQRAGYDVITAADGKATLRVAPARLPDLILLDVSLPDIDGFEVCRRLKDDPRTSGIPVLHMTASCLSDDFRVRGLNSGADGYLTEPVEPTVLEATINALLRARSAEQAQRQTALQWQSTFDSISDGIAILDAEGKIVRTNAALASLTGIGAADLRSRDWESLFFNTLSVIANPALLSGGRREFAETVYGDKLLRISCDPIYSEARTLSGWVCIVADITERRRLEELMQHSQKQESIGVLAGGVAHDFNNLLTGILGNASLAMDKSPSPDIAEHLQGVIRASEHAAGLARQLLAYAGKGQYEVRTVDIGALVSDILPLIQAAVSRKVEIALDLSTQVSTVEADATQLRQLIMNLVINGAEAIGDQPGEVRVSVGVRSMDAEAIRRAYFAADHVASGNFVEIRVSDSGCGMDEDTRVRIFDPFFTTKFLGRGLGLAAALGIIRQHGGAIRVHSATGSGSTFEVLLPASQSKASKRPTLPAVPHHERGGVVLVVDDEEIVRTVARGVLERAGYTVLSAKNGREGVDMFAAQADRISIVLLDLTMPVMGGQEALALMLDVKPDARILIVSGYDEAEVTRQCGRDRIAGFLQKPFSAETLTRRVEQVLAQQLS